MNLITLYPNTKNKALFVVLVRKHSESKDYNSLKEKLARKVYEDEQIDKFILLVDGIENGNNFWNFVLKKWIQKVIKLSKKKWLIFIQI